MLLKNARKGNGSGPELQKSISPSILHRRSHLFQATFQSGSSERERRKKLAFPPVPLTRTARSHGLSSPLPRLRRSLFPIRADTPPSPSFATACIRERIHEIQGGIQARASRFLGSVPAPYKLPSLWHPVFTFFSISRSLLSLFDGRTRRRTAIITTMTDSDDRPTNHVNTTNNNKNDRPGSEAWRYRNSHRGHRGREWGEGRRGTASGARNSRAERGESFVFRNYERTGRWKGDLG